MKNILLVISLFVCIQHVSKAQSDSLDIKIGQMILIGVTGSSIDLSSDEYQAVKAGKAGNIIYFEKNISSETPYESMKKMSAILQEAAAIPLLIGIDQEGGRVNRLKSKYGFPESVTHKELGRAGSINNTKYYADKTAKTLSELGININFAPVVDLESNPINPIIAKYGRAFSPDPDSVYIHAMAFIKAHHARNVLTSVKHFPGHGSSRTDTHLGIADVTNYWTEEELYPYKMLIKSGDIDAVMSAHIVNKNLDPEGLPGTLSDKMINGLLRGKLSFKGVVFSDDMHMKAISQHYGLKESLRLSINAGIDIVCFSHNLPDERESNAEKVHRTIRELVNEGAITESRIDESYRRIMHLKKRIIIQ